MSREESVQSDLPTQPSPVQRHSQSPSLDNMLVAPATMPPSRLQEGQEESIFPSQIVVRAFYSVFT